MRPLLAESWWDGFIGWIFNGMKRFFCWLLQWFLDRGNDVLEEAIQWLPEMPAGWWQNLINWFGLINAWVPVEVFIFCLWAYLTCLASINAARFWRRFLPF